jgi:elongation factor P hydroxylase
LYEPRDARFVAKAKGKESHCGYQEWHRKVDAEVVNWLERNRNATAEQFMKNLHDIYNRPDMLKRFPHGFGPAK